MTKRFSLHAVVIAICFGLALGTSHAMDDTWLMDFEKAKKIATEQGKPILADFSGSDWCGWCIKLDKEVFSKQVFKDYAKDNIVLFLADYPRNKPQPKQIIEQNKQLQSQYGIRGFPTVLVMASDGRVIGNTGYKRGGPATYVEHLKQIIGDYGTRAVVVDEVQPEADPEIVEVAVEKRPAASEDFSLGKWFRDLFK
jgi:protein disulfide-isomerase